MAIATTSSPSAPSVADEFLEPQVTPWRTEEAGDHEGELFSDAGHASSPYAYALPRLLPAQYDVERSQAPREALIALQSWEGVVLDVDDASFSARLVDTSGDNPDEELTLAKDELCDFDLELLEPGAIFYWTIGYRQKVRGARERVSRIRFRRLPAWTERQLDEARGRAATLGRELDW